MENELYIINYKRFMSIYNLYNNIYINSTENNSIFCIAILHISLYVNDILQHIGLYNIIGFGLVNR